MGPGMPNPNALRSQQGELRQGLEGIEQAIPQLESAIAEIQGQLGQYEAMIGNPQLSPEQKQQLLNAISELRAKLAEYQTRLEDLKRARSVYKAQLFQITGYLAAMNRAKAQQQQQQQQAVHAEGSSNRG